MSDSTNEFYVHNSSYIDPGVVIGKGTKIWHFCHVMPGAVVGRNCNIGQNVFIGEGVIIGSRVKIQNNVSVYAGVTLENDVFCGPSCVFTNVNTPRSDIDRNGQYTKTLIKQGATIGANATIVCGHTIGEYAFIGAGAVITKNIPAYALVFGNPAIQHGWVCACGNRLSFKTNQETCSICGVKYQHSVGEDGIIVEVMI
ncbi:2,3,4,5-tetrahydropyridine-26-dicarboxylate N-acetyltransferase [Dehalogenimonas sp. WBC-2]|nr:2,3,4,5-tetrahydropyridine-26-dicarboxylate N-acetyltransferase [Dehalogenimonas sp. WBC-2]